MTTILFLCFTGIMAVLVIGLHARYPGRIGTILFSILLTAWLAYVGLAGHTGLLGNSSMRPPGMLFLFVPVFGFLAVFVFRTIRSTKRPAMPPAVMVLIQSFRVIVEVFIHQLWLQGVVPKMLTFSGANVDIYIGATAPVVAWLARRWKWGRQLSVIWNVLGLLALANVVVRAILTAPGPLNLIHAEVPNLMFGTFPFMFIPGFFVPLAVVLHVSALSLSLREKSLVR